MASSFVSVFKLDGVPILPPLINDEVRAMVTIYRQKAVEIEMRIQQQKKNSVQSCIHTGDLIVESPSEPAAHPANTVMDDTHCCASKGKNSSLETTTADSINTTYDESFDCSVKLPEDLSRTLTPPKKAPDSPGIADGLSMNVFPPSYELSKTTMMNIAPVPRMEKVSILDAPASNVVLPPWQTSTRTVTPTFDESLPWLPLVRSNTYDLEHPSTDLQNVGAIPRHLVPVDRTKSSKPNVSRPMNFHPVPLENKPIESNGRVSLLKKVISHTKRTMEKQKATTSPITNARSPCIPSSRTISNCSSGSEMNASQRSVESVTRVLTDHEQRMLELLNRQEEERLLLEKSFREKTQELVALCAKSMTTASAVPDHPVAKTPELNPASSVSQLSLCDISYNSCTDTDDAAYQTCHANGTSEEIDHALNNSLSNNSEDRALLNEKVPPSLLRRTEAKDMNGNEQFVLLPQRVKQLQRDQAATIINAYARGYLTRRLFRTEEVQSIKWTIVDVMCLIVNPKLNNMGTTGLSLRRDVGKHIEFCLNRLHDIFIQYSPLQRLQMIRRDRYLKSKATLPQS